LRGTATKVASAGGGCVDVVVERDERIVEGFEEAGEPSAGAVENEHGTCSLSDRASFDTFGDVTSAT
jgi:hypothetical protein